MTNYFIPIIIAIIFVIGIIKNIDITVKEDVIKANIFDLMKRNLKLILAL